MRELAGFYERTKLDNLLRYLLWREELEESAIEDFEKEIENSFEMLYDQLEEIVPAFRREDDRINDALTNFTETQSGGYFKLGALVGFRLYRDLEAAYAHEIQRAKACHAELKMQWRKN